MVARHTRRNHRPTNTTCSSKGRLAPHKHIRHILVLAQQGQVEDDFEGLGVGGHDDELGDAAVQSFGGFVGTLAELLVVAGLLDQVQDGVGQLGIGKGGGSLVGLHKK